MKVYCYNVNHGDHFLIQLPNGEFGIIDFHYSPALGQQQPPALTHLQHLKEAGHDVKIAFIHISHPHRDHVKGFKKFAKWVKDESIEVRNVWIFSPKPIRGLTQAIENRRTDPPGIDMLTLVKNRAEKTLKPPYDALEKFINKWETKKINNVDYLQDFNALKAGSDEHVKAFSVGPLTRHVQRYQQDTWKTLITLLDEDKERNENTQNLLSPIIVLQYNEHQLLFCGDMLATKFRNCITHFRKLYEETYGPLQSNFIKAPHHGAKNASSKAVWETILDPKKTDIAISAGKGKTKHPHPVTLKHIKTVRDERNLKVNIYTTNACRDCFKNTLWKCKVPPPRTKKVDPAKVKKESMGIFGLTAPPPTAMTRGEGLYVYEFDFSEKSKKITVRRMMTDTFIMEKKCRNNKNPKKCKQCLR